MSAGVPPGGGGLPFANMLGSLPVSALESLAATFLQQQQQQQQQQHDPQQQWGTSDGGYYDPSWGGAQAGYNNRGQRWKVCRHFLNDRCTFGDKCNFSHDTSREEGGKGRAPWKSRGTRTLALSDMPPAWDADKMRDYFCELGKVEEAHVTSPGNGYVTFCTANSAENVKRVLPELEPVEGEYRIQAEYDTRAEKRPASSAFDTPPDRSAPPRIETSAGNASVDLLNIISSLTGGRQAAQQVTTYLLMHAESHEELTTSIEHDIWHVTEAVVPRIAQALIANEKVCLLFSVRGSETYTGYATVSSAPVKKELADSDVVKSLPPSWEWLVSVKWGAVGSVPLESSSAAAQTLTDGEAMSAADGTSLCALIDAAEKEPVQLVGDAKYDAALIASGEVPVEEAD
eukprot:Rhum_TRINITY_DN14820_c6_g1::Rhum_TRINITY_DN14820_c6_g1_i1::g.120796::m.120796